MKLNRNSQQLHWGVMILGVIVIAIVLWFSFDNWATVVSIYKEVQGILSPVVYGIVFAYILNPVMVFVEKRALKLLRKSKLKENGVRKLGRAISVISAMIVGLGVVYGFFALLLPNLVDSISGIVTNMPTYYENVRLWIEDIATQYPEYEDLIRTFVDRAFEAVESWIETSVMDNLESLVVLITTQVLAVVKGALNILIGVVAAVYMLVSKEKFLAQIKKMIVALMKRSYADRLFEVCSHSNKMFSGFITGKIIDSLIIGVLCYIGMRIFRMPYALLVSTIVGITNVIPFFGPFIGAIPSAALILLVDPMQAVYFSIFILGLQQLDGNVIGPRILGDAVGLPSFWILVSITIFGGIFGFMGMLLGVPVFAIIYMLFKEFIEHRLERKGAPVSTAYYYHMSRTGDLQIPDHGDENRSTPEAEQSGDTAGETTHPEESSEVNT